MRLGGRVTLWTTPNRLLIHLMCHEARSSGRVTVVNIVNVVNVFLLHGGKRYTQQRGRQMSRSGPPIRSFLAQVWRGEAEQEISTVAG